MNMEYNNGGFEDDFPFWTGWFLGSMLIFQGVYLQNWTWSSREATALFPLLAKS